jgi:hypothetical protein
MSEVFATRNGPLQLFIGGVDVATDSGLADAAIEKYALIAILATGHVTPFVPGTHTGVQAAVAAQPVAIGQECPYFLSGRFNHEAIVWPAGAALDTYVERKALLVGCKVQVGHLN